MGEAVSVRPDKAIFGVTLAFAVLTTLLCGTFPAWRASRTDPGTLLKSRSTIGGRRQNYRSNARADSGRLVAGAGRHGIVAFCERRKTARRANGI